jgi:DNA-binding NarL/FixJ family response regulator
MGRHRLGPDWPSWVWLLEPQALAGRPEGALVAGLAGLSLLLVAAGEVAFREPAGLLPLALIPLLAAAWMLSRRLALAIVVLAISLQLAVAVVRQLDLLTAAMQVLPLGIVAAMGRLASAAEARALRLTHLKRIEPQGQKAPVGEPEPNIQPSIDLNRAAAVQLRITRLLAWRKGDLRSARHTGAQALELLERMGDTERALLTANHLGWMRGLAGDLDGQERRARDVLRQAELVGDPRAQMVALESLGCVATQRGAFVKAENHLRRAIALARAGANRSEPATETSLLAASYALEGRLRESQALLAPLSGRPAYLGAFGTEALSQWLSGRFAAAASSLPATSASTSGFHLWRDWGFAFAAMAAAELGRLSEARSYLSYMGTLYESQGYALFRHLFLWASGFVEWRTENPGKAAARMQAAADGLLAMDVMPVAALVLIDVAEATGQSEAAGVTGEVAARLRAIATRLDRDLYFGLASMASAWTMLTASDAGGAVKAAHRATNLLALSPHRAYLARSLDLLGQTLRQTDRATAISALEHAAALHQETGAAWRAERTRERLGGLKEPRRRAATPTPDYRLLTPREREVARLAALGRTAREIARELSIVDRTAETHLANVYAKLGVHSRQDLTEHVAELELRLSPSHASGVVH